MKKMLCALLMFCFAITAQAQQAGKAKPVVKPAFKIGFFDETEVLKAFPGIEELGLVINKFITDTLRPEYAYTVGEYKLKDSAFKADSARLPPRVMSSKVRELDSLANRANTWQQYEQEQRLQKEKQLLAPYRKLIYEALTKVIEEGNYLYVLNKQSLITAPNADDLSSKVAQKLGLIQQMPATAPAVTKPKGGKG